MKLRILIVTVVFSGLFLFTGMLYAANGDLIVNGNLGVGTAAPAAKAEINGNLKVNGNLVTQGTTSLGGNTTVIGNLVTSGSATVNGQLSVGAGGVKFADGSTQTTRSSLVSEYTITNSTTSVTINNLNGNADGGYVVELWIKNGGAAISDYRLYYENDQTPTNYFFQRNGNTTNGGPTAGNDAVIQTVQSLAPNSYYFGTLRVGISPDGYIAAMSQGVSSDHSSFVQNNYIAQAIKLPKANLTRIDIVASTPNGIGANSRIRVYRVK